VEQLIARVKAGPRDGTQLPELARVMVAWGPFIGHVIYRTVPTTLYFANEDYAEFYVVLEGSGTMNVGGTIESPKRTGYRLESPANGGGVAYRLSRGAMVMVPPGTAHRITTVEGELIYMSMHIPLQSGSKIGPTRP
jgi:mannose-6-phosphate isomerase-like protein (cupin superfamily)